MSVWVEMNKMDNTVKLFAEKITGMGVAFHLGADGEVVLTGSKFQTCELSWWLA